MACSDDGGGDDLELVVVRVVVGWDGDGVGGRAGLARLGVGRDWGDCMMEPMDIVGKAKEDASLPKATMTKIIKEMLPPDVRVARDAQDLLIECCVEFINLVSSESNEVCNREEKRTIAPEHVLKALEVFASSFTVTSCAWILLTCELNSGLKLSFGMTASLKRALTNELSNTVVLDSDYADSERALAFMIYSTRQPAPGITPVFAADESFLVLGFGEYIEDVYAAYEQHKLETMQDGVRGAGGGGKWEMLPR
ncbi:Protein Dr1-like protein [Bienertia sinuspersici]